MNRMESYGKTANLNYCTRNMASPSSPCAICQYCGDGITETPEICDEDFGCNDTTCTPSTAFPYTCVNYTIPDDGTLCYYCGYLFISLPVEDCEDNNTIAGDGCYLCNNEIGWTCTFSPKP